MLLLFFPWSTHVFHLLVAFLHVICFLKSGCFFTSYVSSKMVAFFTSTTTTVSDNESHYTFLSSGFHFDFGLSFQSTSISVSISVFSFDFSFDFSFSSRSQFRLPASTLLEVDFESGFTDLWSRGFGRIPGPEAYQMKKWIRPTSTLAP